MAELHFLYKENDMKKTLLIASALLMSFQTHAALISGPDIIVAVSVQEDSPTNRAQQGFDEMQGVVLSRNISVDGGGVIAAGTRVDSHLIFLNTRSTTLADDTQTWGFSGDIIGVMSDSTGSLMNASNDLLAAFGDYFTSGSILPFNAAGLEQNNILTGDGYTFLGSVLNLRMRVTEPGDWIRVVTVSQVPLPAALWLFGPALLGLMGLRRKSTLAV
tara:strand:- start:165 stop:815 length:651 start_codon:yes stop_codon:yes gene_type:complete